MSKIRTLMIVLIILFSAIGFFIILVGGAGTNSVSQKGSDTLLELMQNSAERFTNENPDIGIQITGGGTGTGIAALISGQVDVAQASREIKQSELDQAFSVGVDPLMFRVAIDGIAIIVNGNNPFAGLTVEELKGIYNGTYTNWDQLGGPNLRIVAYGRQSTSGTYGYFQDEILQNEDYRLDMQQISGNAAIVDAVRLDSGGIGYVGIGYVGSSSDIKMIGLASEEGGPYYSPLDPDAVYSGDYVLSRFLFLYTDGIPSGSVYQWISWILSPEGQAVVEELGFYPLGQEVLEEELAKLEG
ncbi:MAG: phosphate ABC transporter substrate-binding protein [Methanomassiliicoccales archaeon]|nr:phosphate ABC transporter substrate-binding protein [Methanomassiliicoccales archaeon]NYT14534.1 phosphate ABC transporter substrate-binding protein [Methanomassiliicoccales archaeon]